MSESGDRLTVAEWLRVRAEVARTVRAAHGRMEAATATRIAEHLLTVGVVDVGAVLAAAAVVESEGDDEA